MTRGEVDVVDLAAYPIFLIGSLFSLGLLPADTLPIDPNMVLLSLGPETSIMLSTVISLAALAVVIGTNKPQLDVYGGIQAWLVIVTVGLIVAPPFVPILSNYMSAIPALGIVSLILQSTGYVIISFMD